MSVRFNHFRNPKKIINQYVQPLVTYFKIHKLINYWQQKLDYKLLPILLYHSVGGTTLSKFNMSSEAFEQQIEFISKKFRIVRLSEIGQKLNETSAGSSHEGYCVITFDDAYQNIIKNVHPIMVKYQAPYTIFVPTDFIGSMTNWIQVPERVLSDEELKALHKSKLVDYGSHMASHQNTEGIDEDMLMLEAQKSKRVLEQLLAIESIIMFSYPYGGIHDYSKKTINLLRESGYKIAVTTRFSAMNSAKDMMMLRRIQLDESDSLKTIHEKLLGYYDWFLIKEYLTFLVRKIFSIPVR
ncbi:MAG: polysaccharide deacetylase family protein [Candidatus Zhuqueibacterota bacterium]